MSRFSIFTLVAVAAFCASLTHAAAVNYHGVLSEPFSFTPLNDDFVIAGTFKPGFDVSKYTITYGDSGQNLLPNHYALAVADGNFRPIGAGTLANASGAFSGSGTATGIDNVPIYLFAFYGPSPSSGSSLFLALATGSDSSWRVQNDGTTTVDAATANNVMFGDNVGGTIALGVAPFPEPAALGLVAGGFALTLRRWQRRMR